MMMCYPSVERLAQSLRRSLDPRSGVQYACSDYTDLLSMHDIQPSMSASAIRTTTPERRAS